MDCYCEEGDLPAVSRTEWRKARKAHICCECKDIIRLGERYELTAGLWDGEWKTFSTCGHCVDTRLEVFDMAGFWPAFGQANCCFVQAMREIEQ